LTREGVRKLNTRVLRALATWAQRHPRARVGVVDGFAITDDGKGARCGETRDARHYPDLVFSELFALFAAAGAADAPDPGASAVEAAAVLASCEARGPPPPPPRGGRPSSPPPPPPPPPSFFSSMLKRLASPFASHSAVPRTVSAPPADWPYVINLGFPKSGSTYVQ